MKKIKPAFILGLFICFVSGCYYDKSDLLFPPQSTAVGGNGCDTVNMKYTTNILPILNTYCVSCHSTSSSNSGRNFWAIENPQTLQAKALAGTLVYRITLPADNLSKMPKGLDKPKLDTCNISKIIGWVKRGALIN